MKIRLNKLLLVVACLFISLGSVNASEWLYQKMYLTSHHAISYPNSIGALGRANLHVIEDVDSSSTRFTYCADVDTGGYAGSYSKRALGIDEYNGNGSNLAFILGSSYPYVTLDQMKSLYLQRMGIDSYNANDIDDLSYQEAIYATQVAVWTITNSNHVPYTYGGNISDSEMLDLTHSRIGLHCNWGVTDPNSEGYCYPGSEYAYYDTNEDSVRIRVNAMVEYLLSLNESFYNGDVTINVVSKEISYDASKNENYSKFAFTIELNGLIDEPSLYNISVNVVDKDGRSIGAEYNDGIYYAETRGTGRESSFEISVSYSTNAVPRAFLYESSGNQDLIGVEGSEFVKNASLSIDLSDNVGDVIVSKSAITGGPEIEGARLTIKDSQGNVIDTWISGGEPHIVKGLQEGKYTLTEELAPEGYVTANTIEFSIKAGEVTSVNMIDEVTKLIIRIKDCNDKDVVGSKFQIVDINGNVVYEWTSTEGGHSIEKIGVGIYTIIEIDYPNGSDKGIETSRFTIEVKDTGDQQYFELKNGAVCHITDVPNTGIIRSFGFGIGVIAFGGMVIISSRKKEA